MEQSRSIEIEPQTLERPIVSVEHEIACGTHESDPKRLLIRSPHGYELPSTVAINYFRASGKFYGKNDHQTLKFEDKGHVLCTKSVDENTIAAMVEIAKAKNWTEIELTGTDGFRRQAWLEAEAHGLKTSGFKPKETDLAQLEAIKKDRSMDSIQAPATAKSTPLEKRKNADPSDLVRVGVARKVLETAVQNLDVHEKGRLMQHFDDKVDEFKTANFEIKDVFPDPKVRDLQFQPSTPNSERTR